MATRISNAYRWFRLYIIKTIRFLTLDMWRISQEEVSGIRGFWISSIKALTMTIRSFIDTNLYSKASSLTYSTILSVVPMLAVIIGIAKGFGLQHIVRDSLINALPGHEEELRQGFQYVENYLIQVQGGVFIGLGLLILLYTVLMLVVGIEDTFNAIWQASRSRSWGRRVVNYLGIFILIPVFLVSSSGITLFMTTVNNTYLSDLALIGPLATRLLNSLPYFLSILLFTGVYYLMPNVRVCFMPALIAGAIAGTVFQLFQALYISGVLWISSYNAIYGSFAAVPLLMLWLQLSWVITLLGAQLSYSIQNVSSYYFEAASENASRRYFDFVVLIILSRITKVFANPTQTPYSVASLSNECKIPARMVTRAITALENCGLIAEIQLEQDRDSTYYHPAIDPNLLTVGYVLELLDRYGVEDFKIDRQHTFRAEWEALLSSRALLSSDELQNQVIREL